MKNNIALNLIALLAIFSLAFALFSQYVLHMLPCAWCVLQRLILIIIIFVALASHLSNNFIYKEIIRFLLFVIALLGMLSAWYQITVASKMFSCDLTFADKFISKQTKLDQLAPWLFEIKATCMDASVKLLGLEYAVWAFLLFSLIALISIVQFIYYLTKQKNYNN